MRTHSHLKAAERVRDIAIAARHPLAEALRPVLASQVRQASLDVESGGGRNLARHRAVWERQLMEAKHPHAVSMAVDGYRLGEVVLGKSAGLAEIMGKAARADVSDWTDELIGRRIGQKVGDYVAETSKLETATSIDRLDMIFRAGVAENKTAAQIANDFVDEGASWVEGRGRADLMARTMSQWAYAEGSKTAYHDNGVKAEWLASSDACEGCLALDGEVEDDAGTFKGETYPLHPHEQCALVPHFEEE